MTTKILFKSTHKASGRFYYGTTSPDKFNSTHPYLGKGEQFDVDYAADGHEGFELKKLMESANGFLIKERITGLLAQANNKLCYNHLNKSDAPKIHAWERELNKQEKYFKDVIGELIEYIGELEGRIDALETK